jgi:hypothetical protein
MPDFSRQNSGSSTANTLDEDPITYAFIELLVNSDSTQMKRAWKKWKFKDVSPFYAKLDAVPTFNNPAYIPKWPEYVRAMRDVDADWFYVSGHHATRYGLDGARDPKETCFFNEPYHMGTWAKETPDEPYEGNTDREVYMMTSRARKTKLFFTDHDNPLLVRVRPSCKGLLMAGCNSLSYTADRKMYHEFLPGAVIIGQFSRESNSISKYQKVLVDHYGAAFFRDPKSVDPAELARKLNPEKSAPEFDRIAVMRDGKYYLCYEGKDMCFNYDHPLYPGW